MVETKTTVGSELVRLFSLGERAVIEQVMHPWNLSIDTNTSYVEVLIQMRLLINHKDPIESKSATECATLYRKPKVPLTIVTRPMLLADAVLRLAEIGGSAHRLWNLATRVLEPLKMYEARDGWLAWLKWCTPLLPGGLRSQSSDPTTCTVRSVIQKTTITRESESAEAVIDSLLGKDFEVPTILDCKSRGLSDTLENNILIGRELFEEYGKISLAMACHQAACPITTSEDAEAVTEAIAKQWGKLPQRQRTQWMQSANAFNCTMVEQMHRTPVTPFKQMNGYTIFCEQWPRMVHSTASTVNKRFKEHMFCEQQERSALVADLDERWAQVPLEVRRYCSELARDRNVWKLCQEQGERETWECNPFQTQLDQATQSKQIRDVLASSDTNRHDAYMRNEERERLERELLKPADECQSDSLAPGGIPKGFKRTDWSQVERTPENIAQGFKDADEYEAVRPAENWSDWMTYIPKLHRDTVCKDPSQLFTIALKYVPFKHPCFESIEVNARAFVSDDVAKKGFHDALDTNHAPMDSDFFVLRLVMTADALMGEMGLKYKSAFDHGWITSWKIGVTHPDRMTEWRLNAQPHEVWKTPRVASEVVLTSKVHTGHYHTYTIAADLNDDWVEKNPPPSTRASNTEWLAWFKQTWLADLITYHYQQIMFRAEVVENEAKLYQADADAATAALDLINEESRERREANFKKAVKAQKQKEAAARQAEEGKRAKEAVATQKREQEAARQAKIAAKHAANERALQEKRAAHKREQDAKFAKVFAEKQAKEAKATEAARAAQNQALLKHRRETACDDLMARLGLQQDASPPVQVPSQPIGRGARAGRGGRGGPRGTQTTRPTPPASTEEEDNKLCVICMDAHKTQFIVPCGHRCLCAACAETNKPSKCPICRADVAAIWNGRVFE
jgi:hypothetical protein